MKADLPSLSPDTTSDAASALPAGARKDLDQPLRAMCPFLKGLVKLKRFFLRVGRSGISVSDRLPCLVGPVPTPAVAGLAISRSVSVAVAAGSRDRSWQRRSLPTHSFASYRPRHAGAAPPGWPGRRGYIWCEFLAAGATPFTASCRRPRPLSPEADASKDTSELAPTGGVSSRGQRPGPNNRGEPSSVAPPPSAGDSGGVAPVLQCGRPGRRVGPCWRSNPSAVPGANTEWGGTMPPSSIRDWHQSAKSPPSRPGAARALRRPPAPGTPRTSSACSACAT